MPSPVWHCVGTAAQGGVREGCTAMRVESSGAASGGLGWRLDDCLATDTDARPLRKETMGGRCNEPPTRDSLREEHAGAQQELRPTEKEGHAKTRRGHRGRQAESQGERKRKGEEQRVERQREDRVMRGQAVPRNTDLFHAKPLELEPCLQKAFRSRGSFGRFLKLINQDKSPIDKNRVKGSGPRTPSYHEGCKSLFPSVLAIPEMELPGKSARSRARRRGRMEAWEWVKVLWALFTFFEGGSPFKVADQKALLKRARETAWTPLHSEYAGLMHQQINRYIRLREHDETLSRGILKLSELIQIVKKGSYHDQKPDSNMQQAAKDVKPERMSLPSVAGIINPADFLKGQQRDQFLSMSQTIPLEQPIEPPIKGCFKVQDRDLSQVYLNLLASGVAVLLPEELAVRDEAGKVLTGGLFAVPHKESSDRIILDRRPFNQLERRLVWARLPHGCLLTQLTVPKDYSIRGSGDDLSNYFYLLRQNEDWLPRNTIGSVFDGEGFEKYGGEKGKKYLLSFRVVAMGDLNAVDIAQQVHVEILKDCHCMLPGEVLAYKHVMPATHCYEGLYIDDHVTVQVLPKKKIRKRETEFRDEEIMRDSRNQYAKHNIPTSSKKSFQKAETFVAWGTEVDSQSGRVGTPIRKLRQLGRVLSEVLELNSVSKKMLQQVTGLLVHPFMHRRNLMCLLQDTFIWIETLNDKESKALPPGVREELLWCSLCLPVAEANVRWEVSS